jgi:hypothetical protein
MDIEPMMVKGIILSRKEGFSMTGQSKHKNLYHILMQDQKNTSIPEQKLLQIRSSILILFQQINKKGELL